MHSNPGSNKERPEALSEVELKQVINTALGAHTFVSSKIHAPGQAKERNISDADILYVCQSGKLKRQPKWKTKGWRYELTGSDLDGEETTVVLGVDQHSCYVTVITVF